MKGIILAGGNGRRLEPITTVTNKHLLAVYNKPMIYYPLQTLTGAGIKEILIISGKDHAGGFLRLLGSGKDFGCNFSYEVQEEAGGIAQALGLARDFTAGDSCAVILGDNIFEENFAGTVRDFDGGARIFLKEVTDAERFGVATLKDDKVVEIEEKPANPKSNYAVTGLYLYDAKVFEIIKSLKPSARGELEITDVNNHYIREGQMKAHFVKGEWTDAGTFESLYRANSVARKLELAKHGGN
jgi:glucose-1-phosphate thymidylyltransferase